MAKKNRVKEIEEKVRKLKEINERVVKKSVYELRMNREWYYEAVRVSGEDCFECFKSIN